MCTGFPLCSKALSTLGAVVISLLLCMASSSIGLAQQQPTSVPNVTANPPGTAGVVRQVGLSNFFTARTPYEFWLTVLVCATAITIISLMVWSIGRTGLARPEDLTRPIIVVAIIMSALILVIAGFSNEQIAPAFGLFGTIVGYMLGRMSSTPPADRPASSPPGQAS
jgi:hypothetical protein